MGMFSRLLAAALAGLWWAAVVVAAALWPHLQLRFPLAPTPLRLGTVGHQSSGLASLEIEAKIVLSVGLD